MKIKSIEFKNFASYGNRTQKLELTENAELYLTTGKNGDGKTTIANAIIYALYGKLEGVKLSDLPNRINKNLLVKIKVQCKNIEVEIERGLAPGVFNVLLNGIEYDKAGKRSVQDYLEEEIYGIPYHVFKNIIILSVNDFKSFLTMSPGDKKQIIDKMFGFSILNEMQRTIKEERKSIKIDIDAFDRELRQISENINSVQIKLDQLLNESDQKNKEKIEELKSSMISMNEDKKRLESAKDKIKTSIGNKTIELNTSNSKYSKLKYEYGELSKKLKLYESNSCPTCESSLSSEFHESRKNEIKQKFDEIPNAITECENIVTDINQEIAALRIKERQVLEKVGKMNYSIESFKNELLKIKNSLNENTEFDHLKQIIVDFETRENEKVNQKSSLNADYSFLEAIENILGEDGVKNLAVKTILPGLNANISAMTATMHLPFHIRFNEKFDCIINHLGENINPLTLSTGERKKADFIIIIAIIKILKLRFPQLNLLFLDELLSSVDQDGIYNILKILSQVIKESNLNCFVINHTQLPHEIFDKKIHIYKENGFSKFEIESIE